MVTDQEITDKYSVYQGDAIELIKEIPGNSIHYSISSIPFADLYTYSNSERDLGNCKTTAEFYQHFLFLVKDWYRVTMPGRLVSIHCMNLPISKQRSGYIGIEDFRGTIIRIFQDANFIYHSEVCIWKDPVVAMQRTKALGLLHKQIRKDSSRCRQGIPDYLVTFLKPGDNPELVSHTPEVYPVSLWQRVASPIWVQTGKYHDDGFFECLPDINPSNTLQKTSAREFNDEKHICPLQLEVIKRGIELWTNKNDVVFDPFMGIGSTQYVALKNDRKGLGFELKKSYFQQAVLNCRSAVKQKKQGNLFSEEDKE